MYLSYKTFDLRCSILFNPIQTKIDMIISLKIFFSMRRSCFFLFLCFDFLEEYRIFFSSRNPSWILISFFGLFLFEFDFAEFLFILFWVGIFYCLIFEKIIISQEKAWNWDLSEFFYSWRKFLFFQAIFFLFAKYLEYCGKNIPKFLSEYSQK